MMRRRKNFTGCESNVSYNFIFLKNKIQEKILQYKIFSLSLRLS